MSDRWRVNHNYRANLPGEGPSLALQLDAGTVIADEKLRDLHRDPDLAAWINRDSPGTLEPTTADVTGEPRQLVPRYRLSGLARQQGRTLPSRV